MREDYQAVLDMAVLERKLRDFLLLESLDLEDTRVITSFAII